MLYPVCFTAFVFDVTRFVRLVLITAVEMFFIVAVLLQPHKPEVVIWDVACFDVVPFISFVIISYYKLENLILISSHKVVTGFCVK